jgi:hypothetical protein
MFRELHDNIVIHASHTGNYMLHAQGSETLQTFTFRLLNGKQTTSVTFQTDGNIPISLHVFAFLLIVEKNISFTMLPSSCTCVLLRKLWTLSYVTWRIFHSDTFPQFIPSSFLLIWYTKLVSGFAIGHPGQRRVPLLVLHKNTFGKNLTLCSFLFLWNMIKILYALCVELILTWQRMGLVLTWCCCYWVVVFQTLEGAPNMWWYADMTVTIIHLPRV